MCKNYNFLLKFCGFKKEKSNTSIFVHQASSLGKFLSISTSIPWVKAFISFLWFHVAMNHEFKSQNIVLDLFPSIDIMLKWAMRLKLKIRRLPNKQFFFPEQTVYFENLSKNIEATLTVDFWTRVKQNRYLSNPICFNSIQRLDCCRNDVLEIATDLNQFCFTAFLPCLWAFLGDESFMKKFHNILIENPVKFRNFLKCFD